jgi:hypothetical protein
VVEPRHLQTLESVQTLAPRMPWSELTLLAPTDTFTSARVHTYRLTNSEQKAEQASWTSRKASGIRPMQPTGPFDARGGELVLVCPSCPDAPTAADERHPHQEESAMIGNRLPTYTFRAGVLTYVFVAVATASMTAEAASAQGHVHPAPPQTQQSQGQVHQPQGHVHRATIVRLNDLGLEKGGSDSVTVLVWATGSAKVGVGAADPTPLADTLRLSSLPAITADVSEGDVHIRLMTPGRMRLGAEVSGGRAIRFTATGRHIVVLKGGVGADTITDP